LAVTGVGPSAFGDGGKRRGVKIGSAEEAYWADNPTKCLESGRIAWKTGHCPEGRCAGCTGSEMDHKVVTYWLAARGRIPTPQQDPNWGASGVWSQHSTAAPGREDLGVALVRAQTNASNGG
jgi:hypothetical protein